MGTFWFNPSKKKLANKELDLDTDDLEALVVMENSTADTNRDAEFVADLDAGAEELDEYDGAGYARQNLNNKNLVTAGNDERLTCDPLVFGGGALSPGTRMAKGAVVLKNTGSDATSPAILYTDSGGFPWQATGSRNVTIDWGGAGVTVLRDAGG